MKRANYLLYNRANVKRKRKGIYEAELFCKVLFEIWGIFRGRADFGIHIGEGCGAGKYHNR